ncbi:MAG: amino acid ABC transporter substrate-binding protein [Selenomonadaceae bacterium]|nr:amino acid ABC transporter substrate-binding protein [Selenomonadaceae bacterium]
MRKIFIMAMLLMMTLTGCGGDTDSTDKNGTIKIGLDDEYAPMGFRDEKGEIIGFDIDLAKEAARRLGVEVEFVPIDWDKKEEEITSGHVDMIWNGCDVTDERKRYMTFSKPYMGNRQILIVKKGNTQHIYSINDLEGKVVGTQAGSNSVDYVEQHEDLKESFEAFKTYLNYREAFGDLDKDLVDVLIADEIVARYAMLKCAGKFEIIEVTVGPATEIAIGFRKDNIELRDKVQKAFDEMVKDGTARKISEQWFQADLIKLKR